MVKVSILVLAFGRVDLTLGVLRDISKLKTEGLEVETVVVDNASKDDTAYVLSKYRLPNMPFRLLKNKVNLGFAAGNNVGIEAAIKNRADFILLLNNDVVLSRNLVSTLVETANKNDRIGAVSPKIYFAKGYEFHKNGYGESDLGKIIWYAGGILDTKNVYCYHRGVDKVDKGQYNQETETDFGNGACVLLRTKALKDIGYLDPKYFLYWEDVDLSRRLKKADWKIVYAPKAHLWHKVSVASGGIGGAANDYFLTRNRLYFGLKFLSFRTKMALIRDSLRTLFTGRKWQKKGVIDFYIGRMGKGSWR